MSWPEATSTSVHSRRPCGRQGVEHSACPSAMHPQPAKGGVFWRRMISKLSPRNSDTISYLHSSQRRQSALDVRGIEALAEAGEEGAGGREAPTRGGRIAHLSG